MPRRRDIQSVCVLGSGPITVGQGCEFDYAGCQAVKVLREEGIRTIVVNSNPATIMTDPEFADATYLEPLDAAGVEAVLRHERPDAILPTVGGQTALNLARELDGSGVLLELGIELIGARAEVIERAEDRERFREVARAAGVQVPDSRVVTALEQLRNVQLPVVVRPAFTLGGGGGGAAWTQRELRARVRDGIAASPIGQVLVEESLHGWDEFELELVRDARDNVVVVCSIENVDPMGVHTGDSVTVAPQLTLSDLAYQELRTAAIAIVRAVGVDCGGANVQFARQRTSGELRVIELNPRVSRSSALASKATGYPIAKVAARLAIGYTLDEIPNDLNTSVPASFEPALDYVVVKVPRFGFDVFPEAERELGTQMKSFGEVMGVGRTFAGALLKAVRGAEGGDGPWYGWRALPDHAHPFFHREVARVSQALERLPALAEIGAPELLTLKREGVSDHELGRAWHASERAVRARRAELEVLPIYRCIDTSAGELRSSSTTHYSSWGEQDEGVADTRRTVVIIGAGPNRIGQGIEYDYCCVRASLAFRALGFRTVMVNSTPATVSTDADTSDALYLEPLCPEEVLAICEREQPWGVCVQFGGQTPLKLAAALQDADVPLLGLDAASLDAFEDRARFAARMQRLGVRVPAWRLTSAGAACSAAREVGYPVILRPSWVLGGSAMRVCRDEEALLAAIEGMPGDIFVDRFLEGAVEYDVDALTDGSSVHVCGIMRHLEHAGIHSGDSTALLGAGAVAARDRARIVEAVRAIGTDAGIVGLFNTQLAIVGDELHVLEANPRASRTVPFAAKATGMPIIDLACALLAGAKLADLPLERWGEPTDMSIKAPVFSFDRLPGADRTLGPRMRSTGEVMASAATVDAALATVRRAVDGGRAGASDTGRSRGTVQSLQARQASL
ncbi:MAG: carbamoyl-phosphate synthase, large subunit [Thermoleophilia bacterium]|nr:carbamoyl-phosphate synthase, large subunit [Thermoleophilia bacterium]